MFGWFRRRMTWREKVIHALATILTQQRIIMADLTALRAAVTRLETAVANLPAPVPDQQPEIDDITGRVNTQAAAIEARVPPPPPPPVTP